MDKKSTKIKYRKKNNKKTSMVEILTEAQKIAFAPFTFQVVASLLEFNILQTLEKAPLTKIQLQEKCNLSRYTIDALFDAAVCIGLVEMNQDSTFSNTKLADAFLHDEMTRVNFNFTKDVCYLGANELSTSFKENRPAGLQKFFFDSPTIYPVLSKLPKQMKKSWYEFDHHYSDNCFREVIPIIFDSAFKNQDKKLFDIGANTGKFERACLAYDDECTITMIDLEPNIAAVKNTFNTKRCQFHSADVLKQENNLPNLSGAVFMSQFLDCFSREQILHILNKVAQSINSDTKVFILEPFIDKQKFKGAAYALSHISLYFTCMANGNSKMYNESDLLEIIENSNLKVVKTYPNIGKYDYTLLECIKK